MRIDRAVIQERVVMRNASTSGDVADGRDQGGTAADFVAVKRNGFTADCPVGIAFDDFAIVMARLWAATGVANQSNGDSHHSEVGRCRSY